jgi:hypothetical protein
MDRPLRLVDLGGTVRFWEAWGLRDTDQVHITLINNNWLGETNFNESSHAFIENRQADVLDLTEDDLKTFDVIFSNSFIEHLACREDQAKIAKMITKCGLPYFIQTPNKFSPIDPHFPRPYVPFFAIYPRRLQARLLTLGRLGSGSKALSIDDALGDLTYYNPLDFTDMRALFPDGKLRMERPFGIPMSILAYRVRVR